MEGWLLIQKTYFTEVTGLEVFMAVRFKASIELIVFKHSALEILVVEYFTISENSILLEMSSL